MSALPFDVGGDLLALSQVLKKTGKKHFRLPTSATFDGCAPANARADNIDPAVCAPLAIFTSLHSKIPNSRVSPPNGLFSILEQSAVIPLLEYQKCDASACRVREISSLTSVLPRKAAG